MPLAKFESEMHENMETRETNLNYVVPVSGKKFSGFVDLVCDFEEMKRELVTLYDGKIKYWLQAMDLYDQEITKHTLRVTALSLKLAEGMGRSKQELGYIQYGTILHDIGKLGIPGSIMQKPGKLTPSEFQVVKQHPIYAHEWLLSQHEYQPAKVIPLFHHERWDGGGYPYGLKGEEIPLMARVVSVVDVWDALTSDRPYRKAMTHEVALEIIQSEKGKHFDPKIVDAFFDLQIHEIQTFSCFQP